MTRLRQSSSRSISLAVGHRPGGVEGEGDLILAQARGSPARSRGCDRPRRGWRAAMPASRSRTAVNSSPWVCETASARNSTSREASSLRSSQEPSRSEAREEEANAILPQYMSNARVTSPAESSSRPVAWVRWSHSSRSPRYRRPSVPESVSIAVSMPESRCRNPACYTGPGSGGARREGLQWTRRRTMDDGFGRKRTSTARRRRTSAARSRPPRGSRSSRSTVPGTSPGADEQPRPAGRVPVHPRDPPLDVPRPAVDDAAVRRVLDRRGVQPALPLPARAGADRAVGGVRPARPRSATTPTTRWPRGEVGKVGVAIDTLEDMETLLGGHPARQGLGVDDHQRHRLRCCSRWCSRWRAGRAWPGRRSPARSRTTS